MLPEFMFMRYSSTGKGGQLSNWVRQGLLTSSMDKGMERMTEMRSPKNT